MDLDNKDLWSQEIKCTVFLQQLLFVAYKNTQKFFEKNNKTGTDSSVLHFDQNVRRNLWMKKIWSWPSKQIQFNNK